MKQILSAAALCAALAAAGSVLAADIDFNALEHRTEDANAPQVFFTREISPQGLMQAYTALNRTLKAPVAVKLSTGEAGNNHYLQPSLIKDLVAEVNGVIVECNTAYGGSRASTAAHRQTIKDHGFDQIAEVDIMDEHGSMEIPVPHAEYLKSDLVGAGLKNYSSMLVLTHFKGHAMAGFGGAMKNTSIGVASAQGKLRIHNGGEGSGWISPSSPEQDKFTSAMAEASAAVHHYFGDGERILYVSVMNNLSVDCDCDGSPSAPDMHDIGILASTDPVALDQACVDLVYAAPDSASLIARMESRRGLHILEHAEKIGLVQRHYQLVSLD